ncbi:MAG TPA: multidrug effflux MFS transporter [Verrucomicrobiae bacterium]|nr:multidrug effflux MFS transporter [Verrucomicrobiae bacterium]
MATSQPDKDMKHPAPSRFFIILILGALSTISPLAIDMYLPSFPQIADVMHTTVAKISLSLSSYFIGLAIGQLIYGPLLDRFGRKRPLYVGLILFIVVSVACMFVRTKEALIVLRCFQALGGCAAAVAAMAMVRDFFPVNESAKILSLLILILGVSPLFAPTIGSFIAAYLGWQWVFAVLAGFVLIMIAVVFFFLPEGHQPDKSISLRPKPIFLDFVYILKNTQFYTFALAGAFSFAGVLVYVAGSPIIFMGSFGVSQKVYSYIFAGLSVGFIGSNQVNILLLRKFTSAQIFHGAIQLECVVSLVFLAGTYYGWFELPLTLVLLFILLSSLGLTYPNAAAMALAPFDKNIGSASALLGFLQIGAAALTSSCVGLFDSKGIMPVLIIFASTAWVALLIFTWGKRSLRIQVPVNETTAVVH